MKLAFPVREVVFGLEDSLVSTLGVVVGIAVGTSDRQVVIFSAIVVIVVEALSMTAGSYLSGKSEMEVSQKKHINLTATAVKNSLFMCVSYLLGGSISVLPFLFFSPIPAIFPAVILTLSTLFIVGYYKGKIAGINPLKSGVEMSLVSLSAAFLGYIIGALASPYINK